MSGRTGSRGFKRGVDLCGQRVQACGDPVLVVSFEKLPERLGIELAPAAAGSGGEGVGGDEEVIRKGDGGFHTNSITSEALVVQYSRALASAFDVIPRAVGALSHDDVVTAADRDRDACGLPRSRRPDALDK